MCVFQDQNFKMGPFQPSQGLPNYRRTAKGWDEQYLQFKIALLTWLENPKDPYLPNPKLWVSKI